MSSGPKFTKGQRRHSTNDPVWHSHFKIVFSFWVNQYEQPHGLRSMFDAFVGACREALWEHTVWQTSTRALVNEFLLGTDFPPADLRGRSDAFHLNGDKVSKIWHFQINKWTVTYQLTTWNTFTFNHLPLSTTYQTAPNCKCRCPNVINLKRSIVFLQGWLPSRPDVMTVCLWAHYQIS